MTPPDAPTVPTLAPDATDRALRSGAVVRWWQTTMFVEVVGPDAVTLIEGMCTQAVERMRAGTTEPGLFLDVKARIIAPVLVHRDEIATWHDAKRDAVVEGPVPRVLLETLPDLIEPLVAHLSRYRLRARCDIHAAQLGAIAVVGANAANHELPGIDTHRFIAAHAPIPTVTYVGALDTLSGLVAALTPAFGLAEPSAFEAHRIDAGVPSLHDLIPGRMPAEVGGVDHAVALDAGCYLGQEPVVRLHFRGRANRTLRRLSADAPVVLGAPVADDPDAIFALRRCDDSSDARPVGRLTTWAERPDGTTAALAILRREIGVATALQLPETTTSLIVVDAAPTPAEAR